jgi:hypothetical protein
LALLVNSLVQMRGQVQSPSGLSRKSFVFKVQQKLNRDFTESRQAMSHEKANDEN